jgi:hypothetical protein
MPMPPGSYLKVKAGEKIKAGAAQSKQVVAVAKASERSQFFEALDRVAESKLTAWHKEMNALVDAIKKNAPLSKEDKVRKAVSDVLGEVKKLLVKAKDLKDQPLIRLPPRRRPRETLATAAGTRPRRLERCMT